MNNPTRSYPDEAPEGASAASRQTSRPGRLAASLATAAAALSLLASVPASAEATRQDAMELSGSSGEGGNGEKERQEAERVVKDHLKSIKFTSGTFEINKKSVKVTYDAKTDRLAVDQKLEGEETSLLYQKLLSL